MENTLYDIDTRTFGVEIEMCDFDRSKVILPDGFEWNKEEGIYNTDAICCKTHGGEINTPPMIFCQESLDQIKFIYDQLKEAGGQLKWSIDTHVHVYGGDLSLEQVKRLIKFQYLTYPYFKQYSKLGDWDEIALHGKPLMTEAKYKALIAAENFNEIRKLLSNQSQKGYIRYAINVASIFVRKTVEFRCFNASDKFEEVRNCIDGTLKMFYYAINHDEQDFLSIGSYEEFVSVMDLPEPTPALLTPLIYQGNPYHPKDAFLAMPLGFNTRMCAALKDALTAHNVKRVTVINGPLFDYELNLCTGYDISIYNEDKYKHLLYELATQGKKIVYSGDLEWLQKFNSDDVVRQVAVALYVYKIMKVVPATNDFKAQLLEAYKQKAEDSITKIEPSAKHLIKMLSNAEYHFGNLDDALAAEETIFFCFGKKYKHTRRAYRTISTNSDYQIDFEGKRICYNGLVERIPATTTFFMFSASPYFDNLRKIAFLRTAGLYRESCGLFLYSNKELKNSKASSSYSKNVEDVHVNVPPDDLVISDPKKLQIFRVPSAQFLSLQKNFIHKVDKVSQGIFSFVFMYDDYCLGGVSFDFPRKGGYDLWQLSDFCTNNNVPRLSKLILLCILSKQLQRMLSRQIGRMIRSVITYAYTDAPVSMKYRGVYKKDPEACQPHKLAYAGELGAYESVEDIIKKYQTYIQNARR